MKISVVVPAYNEEKLIGESLRCIQAAMTAFCERGWETELIVCNNNSSDRTAELAEAAGATVVFEPINQIGRARNRGASIASGEWLVFVDADSHPSKELFADTAQAIASGKYLYGGSTVKLDRFYWGAAAAILIWGTISRLGKFAAGSFIFCQSNGFQAVGGFDNNFFVAEEIDLCKRLKGLARMRKKKAIILSGHPLITSSRKLRLYSAKEHLWFLIRSLYGRGKIFRRREDCHIWYDSRR